ncbi:hypothetical protein PIB30_101149 [Stylosanthes scabra]|uniref:Ubiquitin-like protease family profile domain-containing protein n=1 Tax=Stylosanthes scabra TaxID=79078 RepID=A0ABU6WVN2_9FABA|nr:hypothetical protein [Stylosanthes scabra]
MAPATCIDIQMISIMCHVLNREELPRFERDVYCVPPEILCNILNQIRVWAGAKSILKKGTISLQLRCVDVPKQPNPYDCGVYVMKWMELLDAATLSGCYAYKVRYSLENGGKREIVSRLILSKENTLRVDAISQVNKMGRQTKPSAALQSPYVQVSTAELEKRVV